MMHPTEPPRSTPGDPRRSGHGPARLAALSLGTVPVALALLGLPACGVVGSGPSTAEEPRIHSGELEAASGRPCPDELPIGEDPSGHGFGIDEAADELPSLLDPRRAWVCRYDSVDIASTTSGGTEYGWRLEGRPAPVDDGLLDGLQDALADLSVPDDRDRACPTDLGPRWMVVHDHDGDLTAAIVDDYGCRSVRLTDDPHSTPPAADDQEGTVAGVLDGGQAILDALGVGRAS
ncbi:hypothetical protein [Nocardioides sp.]|uniref:hypothetical protein n=1 Tax=Nocardioides sp. TaxID=35761 RepID=UPI00260F0DB2|nr:hypothetical protein [Nocardioides sp.]